MMRPPIILLQEGTENKQGKQQIISNINACHALNYLTELAIKIDGEKELREMLVKCAATTLSSKLVVDAEWNILYEKLQKIYDSGAKIVLSKLPIGDVATQWFADRYNFFEDCSQAHACTLLLRGGAEQFIAETERSLHDAIMIVRRAKKNDSIVAGGGAIEMELSRHLREKAKTIAGKEQFFWNAFARSFEVSLVLVQHILYTKLLSFSYCISNF
uniref:T-complex protein 1 subunit eta n=1 Tax=Heterorhabditis bacteriophora TaxID=37862 RepID=A0A1I7XKQ1_HETBA